MLNIIQGQGIFSPDIIVELFDAKEARNRLIHGIVAQKMVVSSADQELLLAEIDENYSKVFRGYQIAQFGLEELAERIGCNS